MKTLQTHKTFLDNLHKMNMYLNVLEFSNAKPDGFDSFRENVRKQIPLISFSFVFMHVAFTCFWWILSRKHGFTSCEFCFRILFILKAVYWLWTKIKDGQIRRPNGFFFWEIKSCNQKLTESFQFYLISKRLHQLKLNIFYLFKY